MHKNIWNNILYSETLSQSEFILIHSKRKSEKRQQNYRWPCMEMPNMF